jgi:hypothetical protein
MMNKKKDILERGTLVPKRLMNGLNLHLTFVRSLSGPGNTKLKVLPRPQKATALVVDECVTVGMPPLSPAVREANRRN